jgi:hypothetical protein
MELNTTVGSYCGRSWLVFLGCPAPRASDATNCSTRHLATPLNTRAFSADHRCRVGILVCAAVVGDAAASDRNVSMSVVMARAASSKEAYRKLSLKK